VKLHIAILCILFVLSYVNIYLSHINCILFLKWCTPSSCVVPLYIKKLCKYTIYIYIRIFMIVFTYMSFEKKVYVMSYIRNAVAYPGILFGF